MNYTVFKRESSPETDFSSVFLIFQADKKWTIAKKIPTSDNAEFLTVS